jgi:hypothetical protein
MCRSGSSSRDQPSSTSVVTTTVLTVLFRVTWGWGGDTSGGGGQT